jgi:hypothetical protein
MPTVQELKKICKEKGIKGYSKLKKLELLKKCQKGEKKQRKQRKQRKQKSKNTHTVQELKKICKKKGIKGYSKLKKVELLKKCLNEEKQIKSKKNEQENIEKRFKELLRQRARSAGIRPHRTLERDINKNSAAKKVVNEKYEEELIDAKYLKMTINQLRKICDEKDISYDIHNDKEYLIREILEELEEPVDDVNELTEEYSFDFEHYSPLPKTPSPKTKTPSPKTKTPSPKTKTPSPKTKTPSPKTKTPSPKKQESNKDCKESSKAKYIGRPGPPIPANDCKEGEIKKGNNGENYIAKKTKKGYLKWVKQGSSKSPSEIEKLVKDLRKLNEKSNKKSNKKSDEDFSCNVDQKNNHVYSVCCKDDNAKNMRTYKACKKDIKRMRDGDKKVKFIKI